jgi:hypothetical protein
MTSKIDRAAISVTTLQGQNADACGYWLTRPAEERLAAVQFLRRQWPGTNTKMQRVIRVVDRVLSAEETGR